MHKSMLIGVLLASIVVAPAFAVECDHGQGRDVTLDFQRNDTHQPYLALDLRVIGEKCIDAASIFRLKGMPGSYTSAYDAKATFDLVRGLKKFNLDADNIGAMLKFARE